VDLTHPAYRGRWHGKKYYFGLHYDLHAGVKDTDLGARCAPRELVPSLRLMAPDFVQTDCKGHPGYTSWRSKVPEASVSPGVVKDAMQQWRAATRKLGLPLHCHYSGIWDMAAGARHPEWCVKTADGKAAGAPFGQNAGAATNEKMCPRGPYLETLMIPHLLELVDRYGVDGFWVDGDLWAAEPCYCDRCREAFRATTGIAEPPAAEADPNWPAWWNFTRESFEAYVTRYCDVIHAHKPGVLVCSNWLQTFKHPGEPRVPTDWISGDNSWVWGLDGSRCEARFLSTRGKPWDIMLWSFYCSHGMGQPDSAWVAKPPQMLKQESAVLLSFGGQVQLYENPHGLRDGRLVPWRMKRMGEVGRFVKARRALCQDTETIPQIAVLHSEHHVRARPTGKNLMWNVDVAPVQGALFSLLENHHGVDILDEWALLPRLADFPVVVAPEQDLMSDAMVSALKDYVARGGKLLVSGAAAFDRFGGDFLGVTGGTIADKACYHVPAADGAVPLFSAPWRLVETTSAAAHGRLGRTALLDDRLLPNPAFTVNRVGRGAVGYVPANLFRDFARNRYPLTRAFVGECVRKTAGRLGIEAAAPVCVDVALRRKGRRRVVHLVNRASGIPNQANNGAIDEIPAVGPVRLTLRLDRRPARVRAAFERQPVEWTYVARGRSGTLRVRLPSVRIHAALVIE
jgi:hypothetical protein